MKQSSIFKAQKSMSSQIQCCASEGSFNILIPTKLGWKNRIAGVKSVKSYRDYDGINGEPKRNIFPGFTTLQLCGKINDLLSDLGQTPESFTGRILFMSMFNDISCDRKGNKEECLANAGLVKVLARKFVGQWSFIGPGSEKKWYSARIVHKELGIISRKKCFWNSQKADILLSVQRLHCPEVFSRAKDMETVDTLRCR